MSQVFVINFKNDFQVLEVAQKKPQVHHITVEGKAPVPKSLSSQPPGGGSPLGIPFDRVHLILQHTAGPVTTQGRGRFYITSSLPGGPSRSPLRGKGGPESKASPGDTGPHLWQPCPGLSSVTLRSLPPVQLPGLTGITFQK